MNIDVERIREYFKSDRFAAGAGVTIDTVTEDGVACSMLLDEIHQNAAGGIQGGAIFTLADFAFAVHCNMALACGEAVSLTVAQSCSISYLKSTKGSRLIARTTCISKGRRISVYQIRVEDDLGAPVAEMLANGYTLPAPG